MDVSPRSFRPLEMLCGALAGAALALWLWRSFCLFPSYGWNEIRLAPLYLWQQGASLYPASATGPSTTWIYGPVPLLAFAPCLAMGGVAPALLLAAGINLAVTLIPLGIVCARWPGGAATHARASRLAAFVLCLAIWPAENLRFLQSDNVAVGCGLLSLLLISQGSGPNPRRRWLAAAFAAAALLSKQTLVGLVPAQAVYLWIAERPRAALEYGLLVLLLTALGFAVTVAAGGPGVIQALFVFPAAIPWVHSVAHRLAEFWPHLMFHVGLPVALLVFGARRVWRRDSVWLLPALVWLATLPLDLAAMLKLGGNVNSLHGLALALPLVVTTAFVQSGRPIVRATAYLGAAAIAGWHLSSVGPGNWRPKTQHLASGVALAQAHPGEIWFPWHPLITAYTEGRIDEPEDGLFIRSLTGHPVLLGTAHLPPRFGAIAYLGREMEWGIARQLIPPATPAEAIDVWTVYRWHVENRGD